MAQRGQEEESQWPQGIGDLSKLGTLCGESGSSGWGGGGGSITTQNGHFNHF